VTGQIVKSPRNLPATNRTAIGLKRGIETGIGTVNETGATNIVILSDQSVTLNRGKVKAVKA
jgi:hypothetical protein